MHAPPELHGGFVVRLVWLAFGLFLCSVGVVFFLESELGLPPWDVLHQGVAEQTGLSFGGANLVVSFVVLLGAWALRARLGLGTFLNATLVGLYLLVLLELDSVGELSEQGLAVRIGLIPIALLAFGTGTALYIGAAMGAGPRDSLMLVTSRLLRVRIGLARAGIELSALLVGFALGGTAGLGTLIFALGIGPSVELAFWALERTPVASAGVASTPVIGPAQ